MSLKEYQKKRNLKKSKEPISKVKKKTKKIKLIFVIQEHHASHLHYDLRLEMKGVLKSWAVPKGPSLNPKDKRLAIMVEDHPYAYKNFEGTIPEGNYGAGKVIIWDKGFYAPSGEEQEDPEKALLKDLKKGHLSIFLYGKKLHGEFNLIRTANKKIKNAWLLIKKEDEYANDADISGSADKNKDGESLKQWLKKIPGPLTPMPKDVSPMLAKLSPKAFDRENWLFEIKWDGFRIIAYVNAAKTVLLSRNHKNYNDAFNLIRQELQGVHFKAVLDGEVVVLDKSGISKFQLLQNLAENENNLFFYVFDILWLEGKSLLDLPLIKRKEILSKIITPDLHHIRISEHVVEKGKAFFSVAKKKNLEGIMGKDAVSTYKPDYRSASWLKIKTKLSQEAIIVGYTQPRGSRADIGALVLGIYQNHQLVYIGHAGTGFSSKDLSDIKQRLKKYVTAECPFTVVPHTNSPTTWVKPRLVCEVWFTEWTKDKHMRHPVFKGLREDKLARSVYKEKAVTSPKRTTSAQLHYLNNEVRVAINHHILKLTNLNKIFWPKEDIRKGAVIDYYRKIAPYILRHLKDRPESLNRHPNGITRDNFFQKNQTDLPKWIKTKKFYSESEDHDINYLLCQDEATLVYMANLGCIEINPWLSRIKTPDKPDFCVFDLDPEKIPFTAVVEVALALHELLDNIGADNYCKTSGATGMHIYVPLGAKYSFDQSRQFSELICSIIQKKLPKITSVRRLPHLRKKKVYLDFLQNRSAQTVAAPYSIRPRPGATVSTPLFWQEVDEKLNPNDFNIETILARVKKIGDIWRPVLSKGINLEKCLDKLTNLFTD